MAVIFPPIAGKLLTDRTGAKTYADPILPFTHPFRALNHSGSLPLTPSTVWIKRGLCSIDSLLNLCLCMLGFLPGLIHAWYVIAKYPDDDEYDHAYQSIPDAEAGRVTYYYVSHENMQNPSANQQNASQPPQAPSGSQHQHQRQPTGGAIPPPQASAATGGPDGGRAHRELQRGTSYGSDLRAQQAGEGGSSRPPPSYAEAIQGDNKVQTS